MIDLFKTFVKCETKEECLKVIEIFESGTSAKRKEGILETSLLMKLSDSMGMWPYCGIDTKDLTVQRWNKDIRLWYHNDLFIYNYDEFIKIIDTPLSPYDFI